MQLAILDPGSVRDIAPLVLDEAGRVKVVPASVYAGTTRAERAALGVRHALYGLPTVELVQHLHELIGSRTAIEIGAGHGVLGAALGIVATDNRQQEQPSIAAYYSALQQPTIRYGDNVERLDAARAVAKYRPQVVIASWVTHRYDPRRHEAGGNLDGVVEEDIIGACETYIFIGNERVHAAKSIWALPHDKATPPWLFSRASNPSADFIAVWQRPR